MPPVAGYRAAYGGSMPTKDSPHLWLRRIVLALAIVGLPTAANVRAQDAERVEFVPDFAETSAVVVAAFSPDGSRIASDGTDETIKLWDAATGQLIHVFKGHNGDVDAI